MSQTKQRSIALPIELIEEIEILAVKQHRSFNGQVTIMLEERMTELNTHAIPLFEKR